MSARIGILAAGLCLSLLAAAGAPPLPAERPVTDTFFGTQITDPYRYFENLELPEVRRFAEAQGDYAQGVLGRLPGRATLLKELVANAENSGGALTGLVQRPGGQLFYLKRGATDNQFRLYVRKEGSGDERVLVDPAAGATPGAINYFLPSWDGRYVAYGISSGGSENASLHILEVTTGRPVGQPIPRAMGWGLTPVAWTPDSRSVVFNLLPQLPPGAPAADTFKDSGVYSLEVAAGSAPQLVFSDQSLPLLDLDRLDYASLQFSPDSRWVVASVNDTTDAQYKLFLAPVTDLGRPNARWRQIAAVADGVRSIVLKGDDLFMLTHNNAPGFRIAKLRLTAGMFKDATPFLPEQRGVLVEMSAGSDALYAGVRDAFDTHIVRIPYTGGEVEQVELPGNGSANLASDDAHQRSGLLVAIQSWTDSTRLFSWDPVSRKAIDTGIMPVGSFNRLPDIEVTKVMVPSHDGTQVPLTILARRNVRKDGSNPTILYGYGAYGLTTDPVFNPTLAAWLARGGIYAIAGVRGGGEFGRAWHVAGAKATKPNTWKDGIACAEYLIANGYTSAAKLGAVGVSAGGIFAGRMLTSRPDLFRAIVIQVGVTDTLRSEFSANGATNVSEFGTVTNEQEFRALKEMSTYDHIVRGTRYPAVLLTHGMNDPRVDVWASLKTGARLQQATASGRPVLLRLEREAGHGVGSTRNQRLEEYADIYSFLLWQMNQK